MAQDMSGQAQIVAPGNQTSADPSFEKRLIALQQKERELTKREAALKDHVSWEQLRKMPRKEMFEKLGIDPTKPDEDPNDPMSELRRQVRELQAQKEAESKAKEEREFRESVMSKLKETPEKFELIDLLGTHDELISYLRENKNEDGSPLDPVQIAEIMEGNLLQKLEPVKNAKKLADWFAKQDSKSPDSQFPKTNHPLDNKQTLTSTDRAVTETPSDRPVDRQSSLQQAAAHLVFK